MAKQIEAAEKREVRRPRKQYPDRDTRIAMADEKITRLEKLNASRRELIEKTEAKLNERKEALARTEAELAKIVARREKLVAANERPAENAASQRAAKAAEKAAIEQFKALLKAQGKTLEDVINDYQEK